MTREEKGATRYRAMFQHYPDALTPAQVQEMLGIGRRMVYGLLRRGEIQSVRMGRLYRIGLRTAAQGRDPECPHGTAVPYTQDRGH